MAIITKRSTNEAAKPAPERDGPEPAARRAADAQTAGVATGPYALFAEGIRATYASQEAARTLALETFGRSQRLWWDSLRSMTQFSTAAFAPVTARQLDERFAAVDQRFQAVERQATEQRRELRAELERATAALGEAQREASRGQAQSVREVVRETAREQRAGRTALEETIAKLDGRLDRLTKAQAKQLEEVQAALVEHEQRLRDRLGDRIRTAVGAIEAPKPADFEELRRQVATLGEAITATRGELTTLAREWRQQRAEPQRTDAEAGARPAPDAAPPAEGRGGSRARNQS